MKNKIVFFGVCSFILIGCAKPIMPNNKPAELSQKYMEKEADKMQFNELSKDTLEYQEEVQKIFSTLDKEMVKLKMMHNEQKSEDVNPYNITGLLDEYNF